VAQKAHDSAIEDYDAAIRLNPGYVAALYNRGRIFGQFRRAVDDENDAVKIGPAIADAYCLTRIAYAKRDAPMGDGMDGDGRGTSTGVNPGGPRSLSKNRRAICGGEVRLSS
jgi:tetratricopeptide (TPR) repeat protein